MKRNGSRWIVRASGVALLSFLAVALLLPTASMAKKKKGLATFQGNVMNVSGGGARGTILTLRIDRWSTEEERAELLEAIKKQASAKTTAQTRDLPDALRDMQKTGLASVTGGLGYPLRYAAKFENGGEITIILATNRQIAFSEAGRSSRSMEYNVSMVVLKLDAEGNGTGVVSIATEIRWNEETGMLEPVVIDSQPGRLENVRKLK